MKQCLCKPFENVYNCLWSRPALVLFTAGLSLIGIAFFSISSYVMNNDALLNSNIKTNWNDFLSDLSKLDWCTDEDEWNADCHKVGSSSGPFRYTDAFETKFNVTKAAKRLPALTNEMFLWTTYMRDILPREHLKEEGKDRAAVRVVLVLNKQPEVSAPIPKNQLWSLVTATVVLQSNESLKLPSSQRPNAVNATQILSRSNWTSICDCKVADSSSKLPFHLTHKDDPLLEIYFNMEERTNIHLHLMSTSYFLFTTALIVILYGLLRRRASHHDGSAATHDTV